MRVTNIRGAEFVQSARAGYPISIPAECALVIAMGQPNSDVEVVARHMRREGPVALALLLVGDGSGYALACIQSAPFREVVLRAFRRRARSAL